jgi:hypothetical protein
MIKHRRTYKHALSVTEALERIFEYEPQESSLSEILQLTVEQDERLYKEALGDPGRKSDVPKLKSELALSRKDRSLAQEMHLELNTAADYLRQGRSHKYLVLSEREHQGLDPKFPKECLYFWAKEMHGMEIPEWAQTGSGSSVDEQTTVPWTEVTITLMKDFKIGVMIADKRPPPVLLNEIDLFDRHRNKPNKQYDALSDIAKRKPFGAGKQAANKDKTCKSKLSDSLRKLTGQGGDPFLPRDPEHGYKPRFNLIDQRNKAAERAKRSALHDQYQETRDYEEEEDQAGDWLKQHEE